MTVKQLSQAVGITPMGVRQHLESLSRAGLVRFEWEKRGRGRPNQVFSLTADGDELFPRTYADLALGL
ncbi:MAG TPA: winged helix-turn-helix transcriptional regulator, partial [Limnochordia bacterium]